MSDNLRLFFVACFGLWIGACFVRGIEQFSYQNPRQSSQNTPNRSVVCNVVNGSNINIGKDNQNKQGNFEGIIRGKLLFSQEEAKRKNGSNDNQTTNNSITYGSGHIHFSFSQRSDSHF